MGHTVTLFQAAKDAGEPIVMVTAYDYTMAYLAEAAGIKALLVGDSLGMVVHGDDTTLSVTLDDVIYHTRWVVRGAPDTFVLADLPFLTYQVSVEDALRSAGRAMQEARAHGVKLEGGAAIAPQVQAVVTAGIPVMGHIGMRPQSVHLYGGYGKRGKSKAERDQLMRDATALQDAGAFAIVLENIPHELAQDITDQLHIATIGIGAGQGCDGQIQVFHDLLGLQPNFYPRHAKRYADIGRQMIEALSNYAQEVRAGQFKSK